MNKLIFGLVGVKTSGKSTVANLIKKALENEDILESALANKLKDVCAEVFNVPRDHFDNQDFKEVPFDNPKLLDYGRIQQILTSFNVESTYDLMQIYFTNNIEGMLLETPRQIAQIVGTEVLRATGNVDIHCENMPLNEDGITVISDVRFPNEFNYFHMLGVEGYRFIPLYIQRDEAEQYVTKDSHPSETSVFLFNNQCNKLPNNGSLEDLEESILVLLENEGFIEKRRPKEA